METRLERIDKKLKNPNHTVHFQAVCELESIYNDAGHRSMKSLIQRKLKRISENKKIDIYARQRAHHILNPIILPER